ncbi:MAG: hypothetical protein QOF63_3355 [Thermoanaerobaculia bacterium]|jgi:hypothetical protein|nr:hypothetical protein [Thermoanaerobaculia bacterium]
MGDEQEGGLGAEGVASSFVSALGLTDIFFGTLLLYAIAIRARPVMSRTFPPTGNAVADLVLLASAAALTGKVVSLVAVWILAIADQCMVKLEKTKQLRTYLTKWREKTGRPPIDSDDAVPIDAAMNTLRVDAPALARENERIAKSAEVAMGGALLSMTYAMSVYGADARLLRLAFSLAGAFLFMLAILNEADYIGELRDGIGALRDPASEKPKSTT